MKNKLFILLLAFVLLLSACSNNSPPDDNTKEVLPELESAGSIESRGEKFIENFPQDYPSFELLEYVFGSAENAPIQLVAIARNKETGSSATLFVLDENGVGQVVLASGYSATYCKEDVDHSAASFIRVNCLYFGFGQWFVRIAPPESSAMTAG